MNERDAQTLAPIDTDRRSKNTMKIVQQPGTDLERRRFLACAGVAVAVETNMAEPGQLIGALGKSPARDERERLGQAAYVCASERSPRHDHPSRSPVARYGSLADVARLTGK